MESNKRVRWSHENKHNLRDLYQAYLSDMGVSDEEEEVQAVHGKPGQYVGYLNFQEVLFSRVKHAQIMER